MAGQALIKGMLFFVYDLTKSWLVGQPWACSSVCSIGGVLPLFPSLAIAAAISGAAASFVCTPVERIKCVMQASEKGAYASPTACIGRVIEEDGVSGLLGRGLLVTLFREIPSYVGYLLGYEFMKVGGLRTHSHYVRITLSHRQPRAVSRWHVLQPGPADNKCITPPHATIVSSPPTLAPTAHPRNRNNRAFS